MKLKLAVIGQLRLCTLFRTKFDVVELVLNQIGYKYISISCWVTHVLRNLI